MGAFLSANSSRPTARPPPVAAGVEPGVAAASAARSARRLTAILEWPWRSRNSRMLEYSGAAGAGVVLILKGQSGTRSTLEQVTLSLLDLERSPPFLASLAHLSPTRALQQPPCRPVSRIIPTTTPPASRLTPPWMLSRWQQGLPRGIVRSSPLPATQSNALTLSNLSPAADRRMYDRLPPPANPAHN